MESESQVPSTSTSVPSVLRVEWCNFCQAQPYAGYLTVVLADETEPIRLPACSDCARKAMKETQ